MNRNGFTLVELIATLAVLGIVLSITVVSISGIFDSTKDKTEDVFVDTIEDAMEMYLTSIDAKNLTFSTRCSNSLDKTSGVARVYKAQTTFQSVINSQYKPITQDDLVNPSNEDVDCEDASDIMISIYRDDDYVYYYSIDKSEFGCLIDDGVITNLPEGFDC